MLTQEAKMIKFIKSLFIKDKYQTLRDIKKGKVVVR